MINWGEVPAGSVLPFFFDSFAGSTGASVTLTGLAVTDIEVYKGTSMTQRASDAGYTLLDTDGIDLDGVTGIHGFSIDLGDNTDAGFYAAGSFYTVVVSAVTIDSQTVNFVAATFRIRAAEHTAGYPVVTIKDGTGTGEIDTTSGGVLVAAIANNAITAAAIATGAIDADAIADGAIDAGAFAADAITAAKLAADVTTELQSGLATAAALTTVETKIDAIDNFIDTEIADIQARLPAALTGGGNMKVDVLAVSGSTGAADKMEALARTIVEGVCDTGGTTTAIVASSLTPASTVNDQFNGLLIKFADNTTTAALRGQGTRITDFVHATQTFTVDALTTAPATGDVFTVS